MEKYQITHMFYMGLVLLNISLIQIDVFKAAWTLIPLKVSWQAFKLDQLVTV
jgi:hypothetical protein